MIIAPRMPPQKYQEIVYLIYIDIHEFKQHRFFHIETSCFLQLIQQLGIQQKSDLTKTVTFCAKKGGAGGTLPQSGGNWCVGWFGWNPGISSGERGNTLEKNERLELELHGGERFRWFSYGVGGILLGWTRCSFSGQGLVFCIIVGHI